MYNQDATERILQVVRNARSEASRAESQFDRANSDIQWKASRSIDLFGGDATSRVADIARDARRACDDLYASYQSLVRIVDEQCRPLLEQNPSAGAVREVRDLIKWLNDESEIENNFTASFNSRDLGGIASARYIPSMDSKMIQRYWENKYTMWPGRAEQEAQEAAAAAERRRRQEEARRAAQAEEAKRLEAEMAEYEKRHHAWARERRDIEERRRTEAQSMLDAEVKKMQQDAEQRYKANRKMLLDAKEEAKAKKAAAEAKLPTLGFFAFGEKSDCKKTIRDMTAKIADLESRLISLRNEYDAQRRDIDRKTEELRAKFRREMERKYPIPPEPRKPRPSLMGSTAGLTAVQIANQSVQQAILDWMEPGVLYTIPEIMEGCPACVDLTNQRVSALMRQLIGTHVERLEDKRKAYFRLM